MDARKSFALALAVSGLAGTQFAHLAHADGPWSGPYGGLSGGGGWGDQSQQGGHLVLPPPSSITLIPDGHYSLSGGLAGGGVGYNWQEDQLVYGFEGDGSWADISGAGTCSFGTPLAHACGGRIGALGTARGRLGIATDPGFGLGSLLIYLTGGLAVGDVHAWDAFFGTSGSDVQVGWTIGGGGELMVAPQWSVKLEYLHVNLGTEGFFSAAPPSPEHVTTSADILRAGVNYHFDLPAPPPAPLVSKY
ncbi:MAG: outer membrane beta-barrel protein [Methylovirgula sp.]|jgi:outer membrane immunogenic protein